MTYALEAKGVGAGPCLLILKEHDLGMLEQLLVNPCALPYPTARLTDLERNVTEMSPHVTMADITDAYLYTH